MTTKKSPDSPDTPNSPEASNSRPPRPLWKWIRRLAAAAVFLAMVLGITAWLSRDWLAAKTQAILKAELRKRDIHAEYGSSEFSMIRGLVFSDVAIHRTEEKNDPILGISDIGIAVNPLKILRGEAAAPQITSRGATFTVHHPGKSVELSDLHLGATLAGDRLLLEVLDGEIAGVRIVLSGDVSLNSPKGVAGGGPSATGLRKLDSTPIRNILETVGITPHGEPPVIRAHVIREDDGVMRASGSVTGADFSWRETAIDSLKIEFATGDGDDAAAGPVSVVRIPSFEAVMEGKKITARGSFEVGSQTVKVDQLESEIHLLRLLSSLSPTTAETLKGVSFEALPNLTLTGSLPIAKPEECNMSGSVSGAGLAIAMSGEPLKLSNITADFALAEGTLQTSNLTADILGGKAEAAISARPFERPLRLDGALKLNSLSLQQVASFIGSEKTMPGTLHITFKGGGAPSLTGLSGGGSINMAGAKMISVPVFRKLVPVLKSVIPGVNDKESGMTLSATYRLDSGVFSSSDVHLEDGQIIVDGTTSIDLGERHLVAKANAKTKGATKIITALAGKALQIEAEGSFDNFDWRFKNLPNLGKLNELAGDLLNGDPAEAAGAVVKEGVTGIGEAAGGLLKKTGNGLKKVTEGDRKPAGGKSGPLGGLKKLLPGKGSN